MTAADDFTIEMRHDDNGAHVLAAIAPADDGPAVVISGWCLTPEAALVTLMERARVRWRDLGHTPVRAVREDGHEGLYIWLARLFS